MVFYLVDACSENGETYPLIAVPKSKYTVIRYLTVPIRTPLGTQEDRFVAIIDIDPALNGHCYTFNDVVFPSNIEFRATPGMLEYLARYPRIYDQLMLIAATLIPTLNPRISVAFMYQCESYRPTNYERIAMYLWPTGDHEDPAVMDAVHDEIYAFNDFLEDQIFPVFVRQGDDGGWVQPYTMSRPPAV